jgi:nucleotide-binding universal stress UspA family protein
MRGLRRILVGVDFSDRSRVALGFAARVACQFGAELQVLHAQDPFLSAAAEPQRAALATETRDELRCLVAATWPASQCDLHVEVVVGRASTVIAHAAERRADLIVIAAHRMSAAPHALLGSTAEGVLRRANVSVIIVPDQWTPPDPAATDFRGGGPVIVGVDFRLPSLEALADGAALASALRSELLLVHIVPTVRVLPRWRDHADATLPERVRRARQELERVATAIGDVPIRVIVEPGRPAPCLAEAACVYPHGILALGRAVRQHGYAAPGTTAYRTITLSQLPTLMHVAR